MICTHKCLKTHTLNRYDLHTTMILNQKEDFFAFLFYKNMSFFHEKLVDEMFIFI